ncbi:MAG: hypothetical protein R3Y29_08115 [bacterium]
MNLKFYRKLFLDDNIGKDKVEDIIKQLEEGIDTYNLRLICVSKHPNHILEILSVGQLFKQDKQQEFFKNNNKRSGKSSNKKNDNKKEYVVVGMAYGKKNAFKVVRDIFESYVLTGKSFGSMKRNFLDNN